MKKLLSLKQRRLIYTYLNYNLSNSYELKEKILHYNAWNSLLNLKDRTWSLAFLQITQLIRRTGQLRLLCIYSGRYRGVVRHFNTSRLTVVDFVRLNILNDSMTNFK
jgi:hypothetical protein